MKHLMRCLLALSATSLTLPAQADLPPAGADNWSLSMESDGIKVYTYNMPNSNFDAFKAETVFDAPLENLMAVMAEPQSCLEWVEGCMMARNIKGNFNDRFAHSANDLPWPAANRDYVVRIETFSEPENGDILMRFTSITDLLPPSSDFVRVEHSDLLYRFTRVGENSTHIEWIQHTEPGGAIPSWLANTLVTDIPYKSLRNLKNVVHKPRYQNHEILYDPSGQIVGVERKQNAASVAQAEDDEAPASE